MRRILAIPSFLLSTVARKNGFSNRRTLPASCMRFVHVLLPTLLAANAALAADRMQSGKWESAVTADGQTKMLTYCVTKEEAASINGDSRTAREFAERKATKATEPCTFTSYDVKGDEVSYTMVCGTRTITDKTVYHGDSSEGVKTITKEGQAVTMQLNSRRVGENCL